MTKLIIKGHEPHPLSYVPHIPCYYVNVELHGSTILVTKVLVSYEDDYLIDASLDEPGHRFNWAYGHAVNSKFDEMDCQWRYKASEDVLRYAKDVIEKDPSFKNWDVKVEVKEEESEEE